MGTKAAMKKQRKADAIERAGEISVTTWSDGEGNGKANIVIRGGEYIKLVKCLQAEGRHNLLRHVPKPEIVLTSVDIIKEKQKETLVSTASLPAKLYHITSAKNAEHIRKEGLKPRRETGQDNYTELDISSHADQVYLTEGNAIHYAYALFAKGTKEITIVEVDSALLDESKLYPDEDWVACEACKIIEDVSREMFRASVRVARDTIGTHKDLWRESLAGYGNVAYRGTIPPQALKVRIALLSKQVLAGGDYLLYAYPFFRDELRQDWEAIMQGQGE